MKDIISYDKTVNLLRRFFKDKLGFTEVPTQSRLSILAACEDPKTIGTYYWDEVLFPLPQTGQMWLEYELLTKPDLEGVFCISTSYRNEPNPIPGRHEKIFPMFEFESHGTMSDMVELEEDLMKFLGFKDVIYETTYENACSFYDVDIIESDHEEKMVIDYGNLVSLQYFPQRSSPFWNMKKNQYNELVYNKVDLIVHGQETIGSAERSCSPDQMLEGFNSISDGQYAELLFEKFGKDRVLSELNSYLEHDFFPRFGGGIGISRLARGLKESVLI